MQIHLFPSSIQRFHRAGHRAYTLFEIMIAVAVIGILGGIAGIIITKNLQSTQLVKLESDVQSLNQSIDLYLAGGGSFTGKESPQEIIDRLKTRIKASDEHRHAGVVSGTSVDIRLEAVLQTKEEAAMDHPRAIWQPANQRFVISYSGKNGVKAFRINEELDTGAFEVVEEARESVMLYAQSDGWVWDYQDADPQNLVVPTPVTTSPTSSVVLSETNPQVKLIPPTYSIPGGSYLAGEFDLTLELTNPNPSGTSAIYYQIDGGPETLYSGPITVSADATVSATTKPNDPLYLDSITKKNSYSSKTVQLDTPIIDVSNPYFGIFGSGLDVVDVSIMDPNDPGEGSPVTYYSLNGGPTVEYTGTFQVNRNSYETEGLAISAWVDSSDISYTTSSTDDEFLKVHLRVPQVDIAFTSSGAKDMNVTITNPNPTGSSELLYRLIDNGSSSSPGSYVTYTGQITVNEGDYPDGFKVEAFAKALETNIYLDSDIRSDGGVFFGVPVKGRTIFVLDSSGSMDGGRLDAVKDRMLNLIAVLNDSNYIAIVEFDYTAKTMLNWNKMDSSGKALATAAVEDLDEGGGTYYQLAFDQVDAILSSIQASGQIMPEEVVFLTDGGPTTGGDDEDARNQAISDYETAQGGSPYYPSNLDGDTERAAWIRAQNLRSTYGISVSTIAIDTGTSSDEYELLEAMASDNNLLGPLGWVSEVSL